MFTPLPLLRRFQMVTHTQPCASATPLSSIAMAMAKRISIEVRRAMVGETWAARNAPNANPRLVDRTTSFREERHRHSGGDTVARLRGLLWRCGAGNPRLDKFKFAVVARRQLTLRGLKRYRRRREVVAPRHAWPWKKSGIAVTNSPRSSVAAQLAPVCAARGCVPSVLGLLPHGRQAFNFHLPAIVLGRRLLSMNPGGVALARELGKDYTITTALGFIYATADGSMVRVAQSMCHGCAAG